MKSGFLTVSMLSAAMALSISAPAAAAPTSCSNATIKGTYALLVSGVQGMAEPFQHINVVRTAIFDGKGEFTGAGWRSTDGVTEEFTSAGKYTVKKDCTITIDGTFAGGAPNVQFGVIADNAKKIFAIRTDEGQNVSLIYEKR